MVVGAGQGREGDEGLLVEPADGLPARLDVPAQALLRHAAARGRRQVGERALDGVRELLAHQVVRRHPHHAAGDGRGAAEQFGLLQHDHRPAAVRGPARGDEARGPAADHRDVEFHLGNVYRKLGVRSRCDLHASLPSA